MPYLTRINFNPRSHEGSDTTDWTSWSRKQISIRAPTRGATDEAVEEANRRRISIRAPTRGATVRLGEILGTVEFQSALPRGERRTDQRYGCPHADFNPRSHEGSDLQKVNLCPADYISIRAPAWGATNFHAVIRDIRNISIRAPAWGATRSI